MAKKEKTIKPIIASEEKREFGGLIDLLSNTSEEQSDASKIVDKLLDTENMSIKTNIKNSHRFALAKILSMFYEESGALECKEIVDEYIKWREIYGVSVKGDARHAVEKIGLGASRNTLEVSDKVSFMDKLRRR